MVKNLLARIGLTVILSASTVLYQGCKAMSYQEKYDDVMFQLDQKKRTGYDDAQVIVPLGKIELSN